jgi:predicted small secreted protein
MNTRRDTKVRWLTSAVLVALIAGPAVIAGCRSIEGASQDVNRGLRDTQQDLQHGIRGGPDSEEARGGPPAGSASAASSK